MKKQKVFRLASRMPVWKKRMAKHYARNLTRPERLLWNRLKDKQLGVWIYKQKPALGFIVDFWCPVGIVIEVDGPCHQSRRDKDRIRDLIFASKGIKTLRFSDKDVQCNPSAVIALISDAIRKKSR